MSKTLNMLQDVYKPYAAIIAYKTGGKDVSYYIERRSITNGKMGVGKPLTEQEFANIIHSVKSESAQLDNSLFGIVPSNVLFVNTSIGKEKLVWYREPEERHVYFKESLEIPNGKMKVPGLIYVIEKDKMRMYAFKGRKPKDNLFQAPFMNVGPNNVCLGNAKVRKPQERTFENVIAYWEKMFWQSEFSHILGGNPVKGNLATITKHLIKTGDPFPVDELVPVKYTLKELLK